MPKRNKIEKSFKSFDDLKLASPAEYYRRAFPDISTNREMVKVLCPFHDDTRPSLSINMNGIIPQRFHTPYLEHMCTFVLHIVIVQCIV